MRKVLLTALLLSLGFICAFAQSAEELAIDEHFEVDVEPVPKVPIGSLVAYPDEAKQAGLEGRVVISALLDVDGSVMNVRIESATNEIFVEATKAALKQAQFSPAYSKGKPVKLWYTMPISFKLLKKKSERELRDSIESVRFLAHENRSLDSLEQLIAIDTLTRRQLQTAAQLYYEMNQSDLSLRAYRLYLRYEPENVYALIDYAYAIIQKSNDIKLALAHVKKAWEIDPENPFTLSNLGLFILEANTDNDIENVKTAREYLVRAQRGYIRQGSFEESYRIEEILKTVDLLLRD